MSRSQIIITRRADYRGMSFTVTGSSEPKTVPSNVLSVEDEADLRWYLERYAVYDPFDRVRAIRASTNLYKCGETLCDLVFGDMDEGEHVQGNFLRVAIRDDENLSSLHGLHWELLESYSANDRRIVVAREVEPLQPIDPSNTVEIDERGFNVCLVISRPEVMEEDADEEPDHRTVARALASQLGIPGVRVDIVRPGTWEAVKEYLKNAKEQGLPVHLVHFDVHGVVKRVRKSMVAKLRFMTPNGGPVLIDAKEISQTLASYGVQVVVLNACDSARGDGTEKANLAKVFVQQGIKFVFAMSYKLMTSALSTLVGEFYRSLLERKEDVWTAAASARQALQANRLRRARFGLDVEVDDWIVPVAYSANSCDIRFRWQAQKESKPRVSIFARSRSGANPSISLPSPPEPIGRDTLILRLETIFLMKSVLVQLYGRAASGKTYLAQFLRHWWLRTGLIDGSAYVEFHGRNETSAAECCKQLIAALDDGRSSRPAQVVKKLKSLKISDAKSALDFRTLLTELESIILGKASGSGGKPKLVVLDNLELSYLPVLTDSKGSGIGGLLSGLEQHTAKGRPYYVDHNAKTTTWVRPVGLADSEEIELWSDLFKVLHKANFLTLILSRNESDWDDLDLVSIEFGSLTEYAAYELLAQHDGESKSLMKTYTSYPNTGKATEVLLRRLGLLPGPINILRSVLIAQGAPLVERLFSKGGDIIQDNAKAYKELKSIQSYNACITVFNHASEFEKALLLGLGLFSGTTPKSVEGFALHLIKWECCKPNTPLLKALAKYESACCRRKRWGSIITQLAVTDPDCESLNLEALTPVLEKIPTLLASLLRAGLLTRTSFCVVYGENGLDLSPVFSIHPILTLFLRRRLHLSPPEMLAHYKAAFVEYHEWRTLPWSAYARRGLDLRNLKEKIEQNLHNEISKSKENYLSAMDVAISSNLSSAFPYCILLAISSFGQTLVPTTTDIPDTIVAEYMSKAMQGLLDPCDTGGLTISMRTAERLAAAGWHGDFHKDDMVTVTRHFILYSLWLFRYYLQHSDVPSMRSQVQTSKNLVQQVDALFSAGEIVKELALEVEKMEKFVKDGCQNPVQFWFSLGQIDQASAPPIVRAGALMIEISDDFINLLQKVASFGVARQEDIDKVVKAHNESTIAKYRELAKLWPDVVEAAKTNEDLAMMLRIHGVQIEGSALAEDEDDEEVEMVYSALDQVPGMAIQQQQFQGFLEVIARIQEGASDEELLELFRLQSQQFLEDFKSKDFPLKGLEQAMQRGDLQQVIVFNSLLMLQLGLEKNWQGLREHLHSIWKKERETSHEKLRKAELEILGYWWLSHAICDMNLGDYKLCLRNLLNAFNIALNHSPEMDHLQFKTLVLIGMLKIEHGRDLDPTTWPGWAALTLALVIAYTPGYEGFYARNGQIFADIFKILQVRGRQGLKEMKYLETFDIAEMRRLAEVEKRSLPEDIRDAYNVVSEMNEDLQARKEKLEALRKGGALHLTPENLQRELDTGCLIIGHIMEAKEPPTVAWYNARRLSALVGANNRTAEDLAIIEKAKNFMQELNDQVDEVLENVDDEDEEDEERAGEIRQTLNALLMTAERALFSKEG